MRRTVEGARSARQVSTRCCTSARVTETTRRDGPRAAKGALAISRSRSRVLGRLAGLEASQRSASSISRVRARRGSIHSPRLRSVRSAASNSCASCLVRNVFEYSMPSPSRSLTSYTRRPSRLRTRAWIIRCSFRSPPSLARRGPVSRVRSNRKHGCLPLGPAAGGRL